MEEVPAGNMMEGIKLRIPIPIPFDFEGFLPLLFIIPSGQVNSFCQILVFCIEDSLMFFYLHIGACEKRWCQDSTGFPSRFVHKREIT